MEALEVPKTPLGYLGAPWEVPEEPKELQGSIFNDFGIHFGSHLGPIFHVFSIMNSRCIFYLILMWFLMIFEMIFDLFSITLW